MARQRPAAPRANASPASVRTRRPRDLKIIVEKHPDGFVAYPLGVRGVCVGQGDTHEGALTDVRAAIRFHIATFGAGIGCA